MSVLNVKWDFVSVFVCRVINLFFLSSYFIVVALFTCDSESVVASLFLLI